MPQTTSNSPTTPRRIAVVFGTRPEAIKLMPVVRALKLRAGVAVHVISTAQHTDLLRPLLEAIAMPVDVELDIRRDGPSLDQLLGTILCRLDPVLDRIAPHTVLVQGDTTSALAGAIAGMHRRLDVVHVEAGLRSGNRLSPFPEEINRKLIGTLATLHMAATERNVAALVSEGVPKQDIVLAGNPVVDAVRIMLSERPPSPSASDLISELRGRRLIVLTTHRRENFGDTMAGHLAALGHFVAQHPDVTVVFPVHPNPAVRAAIDRAFTLSDQIRLVPPMLYPDFLHLLRAAWLVVSDSGGIQEEAVTLEKPIIILRDTTERPEVIESGFGVLAGHSPATLSDLLARHHTATASRARTPTRNPFGDGYSAEHIADALARLMHP